MGSEGGEEASHGLQVTLILRKYLDSPCYKESEGTALPGL
jgi:hypothetical protein